AFRFLLHGGPHCSRTRDLQIAACSLLYSKRSRLIFKASSLCTMSTSAVLMAGMPILARITASVLCVSKNGVSPLLIKPLSVKSLTGEASSFRVLATAVTIALSTTLAQANAIPLAPYTKVPPLKIMFEQEELDTAPEHTSPI
nr:hypothetical protein [Tanacetum cinerariifolium]